MSYYSNPIAIFCYNRPFKTKRLLNSILSSKSIGDRKVYIFHDFENRQSPEWLETRTVIEEKKAENIEIIYRETNYGLAKNITIGLKKIFESHETCIVFEDDLILSPYIIDYFDEMLNKFRFSDVMHINGWTPYSPSEVIGHNLTDNMHCWGWATYKYHWNYNRKLINEFIRSARLEELRKFNRNDRCNYFGQLIQNQFKIKNTWAIVWQLYIFRNRGVVVSPTKSYVRNDGNDNSGENCKIDKELQLQEYVTDEETHEKILKFQVNRPSISRLTRVDKLRFILLKLAFTRFLYILFHKIVYVYLAK